MKHVQPREATSSTSAFPQRHRDELPSHSPCFPVISHRPRRRSPGRNRAYIRRTAYSYLLAQYRQRTSRILKNVIAYISLCPLFIMKCIYSSVLIVDEDICRVNIIKLLYARNRVLFTSCSLIPYYGHKSSS